MAMKKILGLDLGVASIGWALIEENGGERKILGMGSRIVPLSVDDSNEFSTGNAISKNQKRTVRRTQRKGYDRYQLRRTHLRAKLSEVGLLPEESLFRLNALDLYGLRAKAVERKISLSELGRILFHLNQKRGYKSSKRDQSAEAKDTEYVQAVKDRYARIKNDGVTIGQFFYGRLQGNERCAIKKQIFPREAYIAEFNAIWETQKIYYPEKLTDALQQEIRDRIIYYQRSLKSQKDRVSVCEFEGKFYRNIEGKDVFCGPKVAPRSSPLFQVGKIWETINNITIRNKRGETFKIDSEQKKMLFDFLDNHERLTQAELFKMLGIGRNDGYYGNKQLTKGIQGNTTKVEILKALSPTESLETFTQFVLNYEEYEVVDPATGELEKRRRVTREFENEPLYKLWHVIYSIPDEEQISDILQSKFGLESDVANKLAALDLAKTGFGNKSVRSIRNILPYLQDGFGYSDACLFAGYNHSDSLTKQENLARKLLDKLPLLAKNSLRQPVVEKILNQMINLVNALLIKYGGPDEIRVELARELKQSKEERNDAFKNMSDREKKNRKIIERLLEYKLRTNRKNIEKWRLYEEIDSKEGKLNALCIYCGQTLGLTKSISGEQVEVEHIIPRSRLFDDSFQNKTLVHAACNTEKGNMTAYDYMKSKSSEEFEQYLSRVDQLYKDRKISKAKRDKLLMGMDKIPDDFISRQLRETQYISRKSREILSQICRSVNATSGSVTDYLRHQWGWTDVLMNLQLDKYRLLGLTEFRDFEEGGQLKRKEVIKQWSKRDDHRHHALDALTVACTSQGIIQRLNKLNQFVEQSGDQTKRDAIIGNEGLRTFVQKNKPFSTNDVELAVSQILVSHKAGKKVATYGTRAIKKNGKRIVVQDRIIVPRGALSEESVYGKIRTLKKNVSINKLFDSPDAIANALIRKLIRERLDEFGKDRKKAIKSLVSEPIYLDSDKKQTLTHGSVFIEEYVIKYPLDVNFTKQDKIVDPKIKEIVIKRLQLHNNNPKDAFKDLVNNPVWLNEERGITIRSVRCSTGLSAVEPVKRDPNGREIGFVKPGNNHHIAIYEDNQGQLEEHVVTFWHAVERKKFGIPVIIKNTNEVWSKLLDSAAHGEQFLSKLPPDKMFLRFLLRQNEFYVMDMEKESVEDAVSRGNYALISDNLFRVQKITSSDYFFRKHIETKIESPLDTGKAVAQNKVIRFKSIGALLKRKPVKVSIDILGDIKIGAYD